MIKISEQTAKKVPGLTSLVIESPYNPLVVDVLKNAQGSDYDAKTKQWEVPITNLSYLLDHFSIIDDIELNLLEDKKSKNIIFSQKPDEPTQLFQHQKEAVEYGLNNSKWLLLDAPGLGKSASLIILAEELYNQGKIEHCLIVCGINTLKRNWQKEIQKFSRLSSRIIGQYISSKGKVYTRSVKDRVEELKNPLEEFFIIINVESLRDDDIVKAINKGKNKFDMIVVDEIHTMKSPTSSQGKNLLKINKAKYQVGATGTLLLNDPLDTYMALKWIGAEHSTLTKFKYYYCEYGGPFGNMLVGFKNMDLLKYQLEQVSLRRKKDLLNLPDKNIIDEFVDMETAQSNFYENIKKGIVDQVDKVKMSTANLLAMVIRLRQAAECPNVLTTENIPSAKIERCIDLAKQILSDPDEKVVIFSCFKESINFIYKQLAEFNPLLCTGDIPDDIISNNVDMFQNDSEHRVIVCTGQKMGTGITLNRAHYAIFINTPWTAGVQEQWEDRIHRIGTKQPVFIYRLWVKDTIDERVLDILNTKGALSDYVIDDEMTTQQLAILRQYIEELR